MFLVNSRLGQSAAALSRERPFSRSYGAILPSSLTTVRPIASVCSTGPPVSVCGTGARRVWRFPLFWGGLRHGFAHMLPRLAGGYPLASPDGGVQNPDRPIAAVTETAPAARCRNVCLPPIGCALRPRLRSRLTLGGLAFPRKPRACGAGVTLSGLATRASILTSARSTAPCRNRFAARGKLPYRWTSVHPAASARRLAP